VFIFITRFIVSRGLMRLFRGTGDKSSAMGFGVIWGRSDLFWFFFVFSSMVAVYECTNRGFSGKRCSLRIFT